ncbi:MAG TPA: septal ring lytic transglycosylase RlpA family protein [Chitinophagaceae bacterium]
MKTLYTILLTCFVIPRNTNSNALSICDTNMQVSSKKVLQNIASENSVKLSNKTSPKKDKSLFGIASFYSPDLEGTETATGEIFEHDCLTAASNNFKLNTWVKVTNLRNGKSVVVRINDRMHPRMAEKGRVVDLTISAAKRIGLTFLAGLAKVKVEPVKPK